jgi:hypothetical protein
MRTWIVGAAVAAGLVLTGGVAAAAPTGQGVHIMDYWQYHDHYATLGECEAVGEEYLYPNNPGGADDYACEAANGGWDLYLSFAT